RSDLKDEDRFHIDYALGKAYEDRHEYPSSFAHYAAGARLRRESLRYDADANKTFNDRIASTFTAELFECHAGEGSLAEDPIFILVLPGAGRTLLEKTLASHSAVEGTMELPDIGFIAKEIGGGSVREGEYPEAVTRLDAAILRSRGEEYLARTRIQRKSGKPL